MTEQPTTANPQPADIDITGMNADEIEGINNCLDSMERDIPLFFGSQAS